MSKERTFDNEDEKLLLSISYNDKRAFDTLFKKYYAPLCAYAFRYVDFESAEEIVQDLMLWIWENRDGFNIKTSLSAYLFHAVYHRALSAIEQKKAEERVETYYWEIWQNDVPSSLDSFQKEELLNRIHQEINKLPESYKEAFMLHRFKNKSYKEIALMMNVSSKTVDYRIQQAIKLLREDFKDYF